MQIDIAEEREAMQRADAAGKQDEGLAKAAAVFAIVAALATMLAMWTPEAKSLRNRNGSGSTDGVRAVRVYDRKTEIYRIPVPTRSTCGGVGVAQEVGTAAERWEAGGRRAPNHVSRNEP